MTTAPPLPAPPPHPPLARAAEPSRDFDPPQAAGFTPDLLTWRTLLTSALTQFLGLVGAAVQVDLLQLDRDEVWLRVPRTDVKRFATAVSSYVGTLDGRRIAVRVLGTSDFLMGLVSKTTETRIWDE